MKIIIRAALILLGILLVTFIVHYFVVKDWDPNALSSLLLTYGFNYGVTAVLLTVFYFVIRQNGSQLGSIFLLSSMVKFGLFLLLIYPFLKMNGSVKSFSFFAFFLPYALCMVLEVLVTIKFLNQPEGNSDSE